MSITPVPTSMRFVRAAIALSNGIGDAACRAQWCTRTYAPFTPISSAPSAISMVWRSMSPAVRVDEPGTSA